MGAWSTQALRAIFWLSLTLFCLFYLILFIFIFLVSGRQTVTDEFLLEPDHKISPSDQGMNQNCERKDKPE